MYTTYAIADPTTKLFVYVGQTNDFDRRKKQHLASHRIRKPPKNSVKSWLKRLHRDGLAPMFTVLEIVETEEESLLSESKWVEKFAALDQPLYNKWTEHKDIIAAAEQRTPRTLEALIFDDDKTTQIGRCEPNASKTGYRFHLAEGVTLTGPSTIDLLPPKGQ